MVNSKEDKFVGRGRKVSSVLVCVGMGLVGWGGGVHALCGESGST